MAKVKYWWSPRSQPDLCELQPLTVKSIVFCYHCGGIIFPTMDAVQLFTDRGETYFLHKSCADKSCQFVEEDKYEVGSQRL